MYQNYLSSATVNSYGTIVMAEKIAKSVWVKVLNEAPIFIRRKASAYLNNIRKTLENEWLVWTDRGTQYKVHLEKNMVKCSCPYFQQGEKYCKHVCAVASFELTRMDVIPWLKKLEERL